MRSERWSIWSAAVCAVLVILTVGCGAASGGGDGGGGDGGPQLPDTAAVAPDAGAGSPDAGAVSPDGGPGPADAAGDAPGSGGARGAVSPSHLEFGPCLVPRRAALPLLILSTGTEPLEVTSVAFAEGSSAEFTVDGPPLPLVIPPNGSHVIEVAYTPERTNEVDDVTGQPLLDTGTLVLLTNTPEGRIEVPVDGYGVLCDGPVAVITVDEGEAVIPQTNLHLDGSRSYALVGEIRRWEWRVDQPAGSASVFIPSPTFPEPTFEGNVEGTYRFYLDVWDEEDQKSCEPATYEVVVHPDEAILVELLWTTPGDPDETDTGPFAGTDVDLHLLHPDAPADPAAPDHDGDGAPDPYFDPLGDCWSGNPRPDWGTPGDESDDPRLGRDDTDGAGPESVGINVPENGETYEVAVHYPDDHGFGASFATVRVYIYHVLVFELRDVRVLAGDLWCVAFIDWPSGQVSLCEAAEGGYRITSDYPAPAL